MISSLTEVMMAFFGGEVPFLFYALLVGVLASVAFGVMGSYVVANRMSSLAGAISHCVLGGIGAGLYFQQQGYSWITPMGGAIVSSLLAAVVMGWISLYAKEREDTVMGALWAFGMSVGLLFLSQTAGSVDPMSYLFGNILITSQNDLWRVAILDGVILFTVILCYRPFLAISFDQEFAATRGINVTFYYILMLCLIALTIVLLVTVVGIVLVIALLTIPAAIAGIWALNLWQMMLGAVALCMLFNVMGLFLSYSLDLPSGPTIIVLSSMVYCLFLCGIKVKKWWQWKRLVK